MAADDPSNRFHLANRVVEYSPLNAPPAILDPLRARLAPNRTKVALIGAGPGREFAPYDDPEWEVWALNVVGAWDGRGRLRCDRWFEMHEMHAQSQDDLAWMRKCPVPIYLVPQAMDALGSVLVPTAAGTEAHESWPNAVRYPLEEIEARLGGYWACTFAYQMALVLWEGVATDLGLWGVELAVGTARERSVEWANVSWWLGLAEGRGLRIHLPVGSSLGRHPARYGIEYDKEKRVVERYVARMGQGDVQREVMRGADAVGMGG